MSKNRRRRVLSNTKTDVLHSDLRRRVLDSLLTNNVRLWRDPLSIGREPTFPEETGLRRRLNNNIGLRRPVEQVQRKTRLPQFPGFKQHSVCESRAIRREIIFAKGHGGSGNASPVFTNKSKVRCK